MPALKKYTYEEAGALLGGAHPLSIRTIERMVDAGDLERIGNRMRRRISERSIEAYEQGERGIWRNDARPAAATLDKRKMAVGRRSTPSQAAATTSSADSRRKRQPRGGWPILRDVSRPDTT